MSNYTQTTNFATKDALASGNPLKVVKGTETNVEFANIATAVATKADLASPTFTGTVTIPTLNVTTLTSQPILSTLTASKPVFTDASKGLVSTGTLGADQGGTGVANNAAMTVTGSGNFAFTRTLTGVTNVTLPTTGTLATLAGTETFTNKTLTSPTLTTPNINSAQVETVSGTAPLFMARAWVNFNGTGTVAIRGSGNVTSITDNGTGDYTVNFTTAMSDTNYCGGALPNDNTVGTNLIIACENQTRTKSASQYHFYTAYGGNGVNKTLYDVNTANVSIFR